MRTSTEWLSTLPVSIILLIVIAAGTSEHLHSQILKLGEHIWTDYFTLRVDIPAPTCNPDINIETKLDRLAIEAITEAAEDDFGLFDEPGFDRDSARISLQQTVQLCQDNHALVKANQSRITAPVKLFRCLETSLASISLFALSQQRVLLMLMLFVGALTCSLSRHHIAFRPIETFLDHRISTTAQLIGNGLLTYSAGSYRQSIYSSGITVEYPLLLWLLVIGFALLSCVSLYQCCMRPDNLKPGGKLIHSVLAIPLYIDMALIAGKYFYLNESNPAGMTIFFSQLSEQASLFLNVGLYIWIGMLLKQTRLAKLIFDIFHPWHLPAGILACLAVVIMALPTAYTGASGIIIIAMGFVTYDELRRAGARRQMALAATAMTGSAGVVLRPCLLVVLIAALNKEVVTDQLFSWGIKVFALTITLLLSVALITRKDPIKTHSATDALKASIRAFKPLLPYGLVFLAVSIFYAGLLHAYLDEFSAPIILPVLMITLLAYERWGGPKQTDKQSTFESAIRIATTGATVHIGALIMLMGLSFATGGVIERSGLFDVLPEQFSNIWITMGFLVVVLVGIGMIMDPFGAVVLVTGTIAGIAYNNGIHPVHFWMLTLVAFELGYLSPPVALNHLLTRQIVGEEEATLAAKEGHNFWYRHERMLFPITVMGLTLLIVAFAPLLVGYSES